MLEKFEKAINKSLEEMAEPRGMSRSSANDFYTMAKAIKLYNDLQKECHSNTDDKKPTSTMVANITIDANHLSYKNAEKLKREVSAEIQRIMNVIHSDNPAKLVRTVELPTGRHGG